MQSAVKLKTPEEILNLYLERKKSRSLGYSMRALARDLGRSPAFISQVFSGKRRLSSELFAQLADILEIDSLARRQLSIALTMTSDLPAEVKADLQASLESGAGSEEYARYEESNLKDFDLLRSWYSVAILDLVSLKNFKPDLNWIAEKIGISVYQASTAVADLFKAGLLREEKGQWFKTKFKLRFSTKASKEAVRSFHRQMMEKALKELTTKTDAESFSKRLIAGHCVATNPRNLAKAKDRLAEMLFELAEILSEGDCTELYQINAQLFSLSESEKPE
jgi:uncharacterized protein (TIGR02147 family)